MGKRTKRRKTAAERLLGILKICFIFILPFVVATVVFFLGGYADKISVLMKEAEGYVAASTPDTFRQSQTSIVYDANGNMISTLRAEKDSYYLTIDEIPLYAKQAIVSVEDKKFYSHKGFDLKAIVRAAYDILQNNGNITQGGSTITQQLARNTFLTREKTWDRKIEEIFTAVYLEKKYSKNQILEFYLNDIYFGNGLYGIQAAAKGYFDRDISSLTLSQMAFLCAIPNNPTSFDPVKNIDNTIERRNKILRNMLEDLYISEESYNQAIAEKITLNMPQSPERHNYVETYTYHCATKLLMEQSGFQFRYSFNNDIDKERYATRYNETYTYYNSLLFTGGYRIYTSINMDMQRELQKSIDENLVEFTEVADNGVYAFQSAAVCIDNSTGQVKAIVGGRSQASDGYTLNRGYQTFRQPGSAIKPVIVYTPILEKGYNPESMVVDEPIPDGPHNVDYAYWGEMTLRTAVENSRNTVAWSLFEKVTPAHGLNYLEKMDFTHIEKEDERMVSCLGGFSYGVSPLEMAAAYCTICNDGIYRTPTCIVKITDADGKLVSAPASMPRQVYMAEATREMTDILTGVLTQGTAKGKGLSNMPSAGKTGTTNSNKDGWFVGYTPYYTTSVWVGYDMPREMKGLNGSTYPADIWHDYMEWLHQDLSYTEFLEPVSYIGNGEEPEEESRYDENGNIKKGTRDQNIEERWQEMLEELQRKNQGRVNDENGQWNGQDFVTTNPADLENLPPGTEIIEITTPN